MTLYLDTSLVVAALTPENATDRVQAWLGTERTEELAISDWVITEFSSALSIKMRTGQIDAANRVDAMTAFVNLASASLVTLTVAGEQFKTAARFASQHQLGLRAGDALHLAICADYGATLCTLDRRLIAAASQCGVITLTV